MAANVKGFYEFLKRELKTTEVTEITEKIGMSRMKWYNSLKSDTIPNVQSIKVTKQKKYLELLQKYYEEIE